MSNPNGLPQSSKNDESVPQIDGESPEDKNCDQREEPTLDLKEDITSEQKPDCIQVKKPLYEQNSSNDESVDHEVDTINNLILAIEDSRSADIEQEFCGSKDKTWTEIGSVSGFIEDNNFTARELTEKSEDSTGLDSPTFTKSAGNDSLDWEYLEEYDPSTTLESIKDEEKLVSPIEWLLITLNLGDSIKMYPDLFWAQETFLRYGIHRFGQQDQKDFDWISDAEEDLTNETNEYSAESDEDSDDESIRKDEYF